MGEVYRARDTQLNRDVAIKVLPSTFSQEPERLRRFEQEACAASALNHPNILSIYDVGTHEASPYVVSELLEGQTLRQRMSGTQMPQRKAIDYALQIAHGLAAAHEKGIIHRDLKPENLFITNDGRLKILDFGLAKLTGGGDPNLSQTGIPTRRVDTDPGKVMGTAGYMSPEQVKGRDVDHRTDIFSFGAILYEMLSGRRAFQGESAAETMSAILKEDPADVSDSNQRVSPTLERMINRCLEKSPEARFHSASDLAFALEAVSSGSAAISTQTIGAMTDGGPASKWLKHLPWMITGILALGVLMMVLLFFLYKQTPPRTPVIRAFINQPENASFLPRSQFAVSPDGSRVVIVVRPPGGKQLLWIRTLGAFAAQPLPGTEDATYPFWSPDNRSIGFFSQTKLKRIDASGGPPQTVCDAPNGRGGTWNSEGVILFARDNYSPLFRVAATGGTATQVTKLDDSKLQATHRWPWFLPDGRHFLFRSGTTSSASQKENNGIYLGSLDSTDQRLILPIDTTPAYASGYLLFVRDNTLTAQPFDEKTLRLSGEAMPIAEQVQFDFSLSRAAFSVSQNGILVAQTGTALADRELLWYDREGKPTGSIGGPSLYSQLKLSADGKRLVAAIFDLQAGSPDIWTYDLSRDVPVRFTFDPDFDAYPLWSPDNSRIVWASNRKGHYDLYQKVASGAGDDEPLFESDENKYTTSWSLDGRYIAFNSTNIKGNTRNDVWILEMSGERKAFPFLQTQADEVDAQFSPDGRWIAYVSNESGMNQVYVAPFPAAGGKWQISRNGGTEPRWRGDVQELFFLSPESKLMAATIRVNGASLEVGNAQTLFDVHPANPPGYHYDVTNDGKRFLVDTTREGASTPLALVVNWTAELKR